MANIAALNAGYNVSQFFVPPALDGGTLFDEQPYYNTLNAQYNLVNGATCPASIPIKAKLPIQVSTM